jgi:glutathione peroxidase-family protein
LAARTDWRFHKCFVQRQHVIKRFVARAEDE